MPRLSPAIGLLALALTASCWIEDRTPAGSRQDEGAIRAILREYYQSVSDGDWIALRALFSPGATVAVPDRTIEGRTVFTAGVLPVDSALSVVRRTLANLNAVRFEGRMLRADVRQHGDIAAVWVTADERLVLPTDSTLQREVVEHFTLRRSAGRWSIVSAAW